MLDHGVVGCASLDEEDGKWCFHGDCCGLRGGLVEDEVAVEG